LGDVHTGTYQLSGNKGSDSSAWGLVLMIFNKTVDGTRKIKFGSGTRATEAEM
jgi:hypothetical protein